ncbi:MAG: 16S rRNA (guanine(527)-N(7))-methyltransferase RsmG [Bacteroidota bacterium]|nr:16S rRNA (guanine(527)-N(7))-methyltransferase RsmG [Bacteroidota bacterium]|tara:strand:+ start:617 stop:1231 length:615 start_codon:yes stop_codon:yes gene_type:complete
MSKYFDLLERYHMEISQEKLEIYRSLYGIYKDLNDKVNLISRKDFENFYLHHIIHSLSITKFELIKDENNIIDLGTGGGLPGIPLAIYYNRKNFLLVDSIRKKISAVDKIINKINAKNISTLNNRAENLDIKADIIICRSVSSVDNLIQWTKGLLNDKGRLILLKGGNVNKELKNISSRFTIYNLDDIYSENYFKDKKIIEIHR